MTGALADVGALIGQTKVAAVEEGKQKWELISQGQDGLRAALDLACVTRANQSWSRNPDEYSVHLIFCHTCVDP